MFPLILFVMGSVVCQGIGFVSNPELAPKVENGNMTTSQESSGTNDTTTVTPTDANGTTNAKPEEPCVDLEPDCSKYLETFCKDQNYIGLMATRCAKTCNLCCIDKFSNCKTWGKNGFCKSVFYDDKAKKMCSETCGFCDPEK